MSVTVARTSMSPGSTGVWTASADFIIISARNGTTRTGSPSSMRRIRVTRCPREAARALTFARAWTAALASASALSFCSSRNAKFTPCI